MRVVINVAEEFNPNKNDMLIFDGKKWKTANYKLISEDLFSRISKLEEKNAKLEKEFSRVLEIIKEEILNG